MGRKKSSKKDIKESKAKDKKNRKKNKKKFGEKHPKIALALKLIVILILIIAVVGAGIIAGYIYGFFGDDFEITEEELKISVSNSVVVDSEGEVIADLSGDEKRKIVTLDEMADYLPKAYVAIEDERFYQHNGVDLKRTAHAIVTYVLHGGSSSFGGSTITQQLVKNITQDSDKTAFRKIKEWAKAYQVEKILTKDEILELYLNILFVGGSNNGVELGAEYYFNKTAKELDLAECAFLAGINNSPNSYNPYSTTTDNSEKIKNRTLTVLKKMKDLGYIEDEAEYNEATQKVEAGLVFTKGQTSGNVYSYHTDAAISQVVNQVAEEKGISKSLAENYVYSSGLTIYSTQVSSIQDELEKVFSNTSKYSKASKKNSGEYSQAAMVIIDQSTGYVVGTVGGLGEKTESRGLNRATQSTRQTGSATKPISAIIPGLEEGIITAATMYDDSETVFTGNYTPKNYNRFTGLTNIRQSVKTSQNIPFIKVVAELTPKKSLEYMKKMGITSLDDTKDNVLAASIGGLTNGISPLEMAAAYATIANDGVYIEPTFYTKVTDINGETVLTPNQTTTRVCSEANAYIAKDLLTEPVVGSGGTATYCAIKGIDVAAKTGTTNSDYDRWLCGFTNYYTAATWYGFDNNESVVFSGNPAGLLWDEVMTAIHSSLPSSRFEQPSNIVTATICTATGQKATSKCTSTYSEIFVEGTVPEDCAGHTTYNICTESGLIANEYCPDTERRSYGYVIPKEQLNLWKTTSSSSSEEAPTEICNIHKKAEETTNNSSTTEEQDTDAPTITLNGKQTIKLSVGEAYEEPGASATDKQDGDLTSSIKISGTVDTSKAGTYTVVYTVSDKAGNSTTKKRTVKVTASSTETEPDDTPDTQEPSTDTDNGGSEE